MPSVFANHRTRAVIALSPRGELGVRVNEPSSFFLDSACLAAGDLIALFESENRGSDFNSRVGFLPQKEL